MGSHTYDVAIIGGGIVGCAVLRELTDQGYHCILLEKEEDLASGATGGNSGLLHTGFDSVPGTQEAKLIQQSQDLYRKLAKHNVLIVRRHGAVMIAQNKQQVEKLQSYIRTAHQNGVTDARLLTAEEVLALEPNINPSVVKGGMIVPEESMIDSNLVAVTLAHSALRQGAKIQYSSEVTGAQFISGIWEMMTARGRVRAAHVINAAGLYGDRVEKLAGFTPPFTIKPRRGQFVVFNKAAGSLINHIILPVPSENTKGIIIFTSVYGNLVVGPTAEEVDERKNPSVNQQTIDELVHYAQEVVPALKGAGPKEEGPVVIGSYAGLRPATAESKDYHIYTSPNKKWITVAGIRSTGQSACLGIAKKVADLLTSDLRARPSRSTRSRSSSTAVAWITDRPSYVLDGVEYNVRHPLMKYGLSKPKAKL